MPQRITHPSCPLCPNAKIHRIHERFDHFESYRTLRKEQRVDFWTVSLLRAARQSVPRIPMDVEQATDLAWKLMNAITEDLRGS